MSVDNITNPNTKQINGPVNIIRLEGVINGIKKVIYIFMDMHKKIIEQSQCQNIFSLDIQKYFSTSFYKLNKLDKKYDFFLEIYPSYVHNNIANLPNSYLRNRYIDEIMKFFRNIFVYNPKKNKVTINKMFHNLRLHYFDIRNYYSRDIESINDKLTELMDTIVNKNNITSSDITNIKKILNIIEKRIQFTIDVLEKPSETLRSIIIKKSTDKIDKSAIEYLSNKIKTSYQNKNLQNVMAELLNNSISDFKKVISSIKSIHSFIDNQFNKMDNSKFIRNLDKQIEYVIMDEIDEFFARFIDIYFLRRFLDKNYITNAIAYVGVYHANTYIRVLVQKFGFKITNIYYSKIKNINVLNEKIKKASLADINNMITPEIIIQCSDMEGFPDNFL